MTPSKTPMKGRSLFYNVNEDRQSENCRIEQCIGCSTTYCMLRVLLYRNNIDITSVPSQTPPKLVEFHLEEPSVDFLHKFVAMHQMHLSGE
jgi:hypothetical protein